MDEKDVIISQLKLENYNLKILVTELNHKILTIERDKLITESQQNGSTAKEG